MEIYSNPFDWGCHWVCNKLDCGKDVIPSKKRDSCIWEETSLYTRSYPKDDWQEQLEMLWRHSF